MKSNFTLTYGLRFSHHAAGTRGQRATAFDQHPDRRWLNKRGALADQGLSDQGAGIISYAPGGRPYYPQHNNWQPRLGMAYSPKGESGISKFLFGPARLPSAPARACTTT